MPGPAQSRPAPRRYHGAPADEVRHLRTLLGVRRAGPIGGMMRGMPASSPICRHGRQPLGDLRQRAAVRSRGAGAGA
jgi:hypothetical protein